MARRGSLSISNILILIGTGLLLVAIFWWYRTFGFEMDFIKCLVVESGRCRLSMVKGILGDAQYSPYLMYTSLGCLLVGLVLGKLGR